jgi:hypothetical protein
MHHWLRERPQDAECTSGNSSGSCSRRVTQWLCMNDPNWPPKTRSEILDNRGGLLEPIVWSSQPWAPAHLHSAKADYNADKANENRNRHSSHEDWNKWCRLHPSSISRFVISSWDWRTMWKYTAKIWETLTVHLSRHAQGIRDTEWFELQKHRKRVRGNNSVPGHKKPHKRPGSRITWRCSKESAELGTSRPWMSGWPITLFKSRKMNSTKSHLSPGMQFQ